MYTFSAFILIVAMCLVSSLVKKHIILFDFICLYNVLRGSRA